MRKTRFAGLALALIVAPSIAAAAQELPARRIMVSLLATGGSDEAELRDSLVAALAASPLASAVLDGSGKEPGLIEAAGMAACTLALAVEVKESSVGVDVAWRYLSPAAGGQELVTGSFKKARPGARDLASSFWTEVAQDLGPAIAALNLDRITVIAPPGARIEGFGEAFSMPESGNAEVELALPAFVNWKAYSSTYLDASGSIFIEEPGSRLELPIKAAPTWTAELSLYGFSFLEARASKLYGKRLFARATLTQFFAGLSLQNDNGSSIEPSLVSSFSLIQAGAGFGAYFEGPEKSLRFYAAADAFFRFSLPEYSSVVLDPEIPFGLFPLLGAEWGLETRTKLYLEFGGAFYPFADTSYVEAIRKNNHGGTLVADGHWGSSSGPGWSLEFPVPRLGLRMYF
jgi:hypothetical protein